MLRVFAGDLHVHTCLSPCADLTMAPRVIARMAADRGLDAIGICDHNSAENAPAAARAAEAVGVKVLPGIEITSREEVHILALFDRVDDALQMQDIVYRRLPGRSDPRRFGLQVRVNEDHDVLGLNDRLLAGVTELAIEDAVDSIHALGGVAIAAHIDRQAFSVLSQLAFIPDALPLDGLELSVHTSFAEARRRYPEYAWRGMVRSSDAHSPEQIGAAATWFLLDEVTSAEIAKALNRKDGRLVLERGPSMEELSLHVLDIVENSIEAGAKHVDILIQEDLSNDILRIQIVDDGRGMDPQQLAICTDPFYTTRKTRRVGLGLPVLAQAAKAAGGDLEIESRSGAGTKVTAVFRRSHIDRQPMGDIGGTLLVLVVGHPEIEFTCRYQTCGREVAFSTSEILCALGGAPIHSPEGIEAVSGALEKFRNPDST